MAPPTPFRKISSPGPVLAKPGPGPAQARPAEPLGDLVAGLAHDLNNQLGAIQGHLELAALPGTPERTARGLDHAQEAIRRSSMLIRRLLAVVRHSRSRAEPLEVNDVATASVQAARHVFAGRVHIELELDPLAAPVSGVRCVLGVAIDELIARACAQSPREGTVVLRTTNVILDDTDRVERPWVRPGGYLRLEVEDAGPPLTHDAHAHFFDPTYAETLGLSTACAAVKQHHGYIDVTRRGDRTVFRLELPVV